MAALAGTIGDSLGITPEIVFKPTRKGEVTRYIANIGKARALLGYNPTTSLEQGVPKSVAWALEWWAKHPLATPS